MFASIKKSPTEEELELQRQRGLASAARQGLSPRRVRAGYALLTPAGVGNTPSPIPIVNDDEGEFRTQLDDMYGRRVTPNTIQQVLDTEASVLIQEALDQIGIPDMQAYLNSLPIPTSPPADPPLPMSPASTLRVSRSVSSGVTVR